MLNKNKTCSGTVAVLGFGAVVEKYYLPADRIDGKNSRIYCIVDTKNFNNPDILGNIQYIKESYSEGLAKLKNMPIRPQSVYIALPNWMHVEASVMALENGFNVLCEKPMALSISECNILEKSINKTGAKFAVGMNRRYLPSLQVLKKLIDQKIFGEINLIEIKHGSYYSWYSRIGTYFDRRSHGALADMGVHYLDLLLHLLGDIEPTEYRDDSKGGIESHFIYNFKSKSIDIKLEISRKYKLKNQIKIVGKLGEAIVDVDGDSGVNFRSKTNSGIVAKYFQNEFDSSISPIVLAFKRQFDDFDNYINNRKSTIANFDDGKKVTILLDWAYTNKKSIPIFNTMSYINKDAVNKCNVVKIQNMDILVTGGSGFIGGKLVNRLTHDNNNRVTVPIRSFMTIVELSNYNIVTPLIKTFDYKTCLEITKGKTVIFHLANGKNPKDAVDITINGTKNLLMAAAKNGVKSVVVISTYSVFGRPTQDIQVNESYPYKPNLGYYGKTKAIMEKWVLKFANLHRDMNIVVLNPTCVWGPDSGTYFTLPYNLMMENKFCLIEGKKSIANIVFVENLIDAMITVAKCNDISGRRFIVNDISMNWSKFFESLIGLNFCNIPDYSLNEFVQLSTPCFSGFGDIISALIASDHLRAVVKNNSIISPFFKMFWTNGYNKVIEANTSLNKLSQNRNPPPWLLDIFPVAQSVFSSENLRIQTGWRPSFSFDSAMEITKEWAKSSGYCK